MMMTRNQRQVVINEVMWAHDESFRGNPERIVVNSGLNFTIEAPHRLQFSDIELTTSKEFPGPPPETDMLSNVPSYDITWEIDDKGQHGSSKRRGEISNLCSVLTMTMAGSLHIGVLLPVHIHGTTEAHLAG